MHSSKYNELLCLDAGSTILSTMKLKRSASFLHPAIDKGLLIFLDFRLPLRNTRKRFLFMVTPLMHYHFEQFAALE